MFIVSQDGSIMAKLENLAVKKDKDTENYLLLHHAPADNNILIMGIYPSRDRAIKEIGHIRQSLGSGKRVYTITA